MHGKTWACLTPLVIVACATQNPPSVEDTPTPVDTPFSYADGTARYAWSAQRRIEQEVAGQTTRSDIVIRLLLSTRIERNGDSRNVQFSIDSLQEVTGPGFTVAMQRAVTGTTFEGSFDPTGAVAGLNENVAPSPLMANVTTVVREFFPRLPTAGVQPGVEWVDTTSVATNDGSTRITKTSVVYSTAGEWSADRSNLPVEWRAEYVLRGEGQQMGQSFTLLGGGVTEGAYRLSSDGVYLGGMSRDSSAAEVSLPSLGISVPIVQVGVDSVRIQQ